MFFIDFESVILDRPFIFKNKIKFKRYAFTARFIVVVITIMFFKLYSVIKFNN